MPTRTVRSLTLISLLFPVCVNAESIEIYSNPFSVLSVEDCKLVQTGSANYPQPTAMMNLNEVSLMLEREGQRGGTSLFFLRSTCSDDEQQCLPLQNLKNLKFEQNLTVACDDISIDCIRKDKEDGTFSLHNLNELYDGGGDYTEQERQAAQHLMASQILPLIEQCKSKYPPEPPKDRTSTEELMLDAQDAVRVELQIQDLAFSDVTIKTDGFLPKICGYVQSGANEKLRFFYDESYNVVMENGEYSADFDKKFWAKCCP